METYSINGKEYTQQSLVWGQVKQLRVLMEKVTWPGDLNPISFVDLLGEYFPEFAAIVLRESGKSLKDKNIEKLIEEFSEELSLDVSVKIVNDFFVCNPIDSLFSGLSGLLKKMNESLDQTNMMMLIPSTKSVSSLPEEISPNSTQ